MLCLRIVTSRIFPPDDWYLVSFIKFNCLVFKNVISLKVKNYI